MKDANTQPSCSSLILHRDETRVRRRERASSNKRTTMGYEITVFCTTIQGKELAQPFLVQIQPLKEDDVRAITQ